MANSLDELLASIEQTAFGPPEAPPIEPEAENKESDFDRLLREIQQMVIAPTEPFTPAAVQPTGLIFPEQAPPPEPPAPAPAAPSAPVQPPAQPMPPVATEGGLSAAEQAMALGEGVVTTGKEIAAAAKRGVVESLPIVSARALVSGGGQLVGGAAGATEAMGEALARGGMTPRGGFPAMPGVGKALARGARTVGDVAEALQQNIRGPSEGFIKDMAKNPEKAPTIIVRELFQNLPTLVAAGASLATMGPVGGMLFMATQEGGHQYRQLLELGVDPETALPAALAVGAVNGTLEMIPLYRFLARARGAEAAKRLITDVAIQAGLEAGTEGSQEIVSILSERANAPWIERNLTDDMLRVGDAALIGGLLGGLIGGAARRVGKLPAPPEISREPPPERAIEEAITTTPAAQELPPAEPELPAPKPRSRFIGRRVETKSERSDFDREGAGELVTYTAYRVDPGTGEEKLVSLGGRRFTRAEFIERYGDIEGVSDSEVRHIAIDEEKNFDKGGGVVEGRVYQEGGMYPFVSRHEANLVEPPAAPPAPPVEEVPPPTVPPVEEAPAPPPPPRAPRPEAPPVIPPEVVGRPELAVPTEEEKPRSFVAAVQEERKAIKEEPRPRMDKVVEAAAEKRFQDKGLEASRQQFLAEGIKSDEDVAVAKRVVQELTTKALTSENAADLARAREVVLKYHEEGTEQARAFRFRRDMTMNPRERVQQAVRDAVIYPSQRLVGQLRRAKTDEQRAKIEAAYAQEVVDARQKIQDVGIDLEKILTKDEELTQPELDEALWAAQLAHASKADLTDKILEYWRASILTAVPTHMANFAGNTTHTLWEYYVQRPMEATWNQLVAKDPEGPRTSEISAYTKALFNINSIRRSWRFGRRAFATEYPVFSEQFGDTEAMRVDAIRSPRGAIVGPVFKNPFTGKGTTAGRIIRTPFRGLMAADEIAKSLIYEMEIAASAERQAKGDKARFDELMQDPTDEMIKDAYDQALYLTFQTRLGAAGRGLLTARRGFRPIAFVLPFIVTPANITKVSIKKSPLGIINVLRKWKRHRLYNIGKSTDPSFIYTKREAGHDIAEQILAWSAAMMFIGLVGDEDDEAWITGSRPPGRGEAELGYRTGPPQSIRVGEQWYSYSRIEPLAFPLTFLVDAALSVTAAASKEDADISREWQRLYSALASLVRDKTFLRGLGDIIEMAEQAARGESGGLVRYSSGFATSFVPNIIKSAARASAPFLRDRRVSGDRVAWGVDAGKVFVQESFPAYGPTRHDLWGREVRLGEPTQNPMTDFLFRLTSPVRSSKAEKLAPDRLILNYNNRYPADGFYPRMPQRRFVRDGKTIQMSREKYQEFVRKSGQLAYERVLRDIRRRRLNVEKPTEKDRKHLEGIIRKARSETKKTMFGGRKRRPTPRLRKAS